MNPYSAVKCQRIATKFQLFVWAHKLAMETDNPCSINPLCDKGIFHNKDSKKRSYGPHLYACMFQESSSFAWRALQMDVDEAVSSWTMRTCDRMTIKFELDIR